ncbi:MAG: prenyltransferase [Nitrososphaeraceae archaeon]
MRVSDKNEGLGDNSKRMEIRNPLYAWSRVVRLRFVLSSVIAVLLGVSIVYYETAQVNISFTLLILAGVVFLHFSIDLLNDYWDYVKGIDKITRRTKFSGGTGVLPTGLLKAKHVYIVGLLFLVMGSLIGIYFIVLRGPIVGVILGIAVFSVYTYSNRLVYRGLGEFFVALKGALIVFGTYYVLTNLVEFIPFYNGIILGVLSGCILFITSFPDFDADKSKGRKTLAISLGKEQAVRLYPILLVSPFVLIILGVAFNLIVIYSLICFISIPYFFKAVKGMKRAGPEGLLTAMESTLVLARITGTLLIVSYLLAAHSFLKLTNL